MSFKIFNFNDHISNGLKSLGYVSPTPIQQKAIQPILDGRDLLGLAQTGTGKTAAFALPILAEPQLRKEWQYKVPYHFTDERACSADVCLYTGIFPKPEYSLQCYIWRGKPRCANHGS